MAFFSSWLGAGKSRGAKAAGRITVTAPALSFKPAVEALELRAMPDATLVTKQPDFNSQTGILDIPADAAVQVLGASSNGRYLLLQSQATNLSRVLDASLNPQPQVSAPGQTNIFYLERGVGGVNNNITLISSYNPVPAFDQQFVPGQKGLGVLPSVPGVNLNAVISDDGQSVAFLSGANAALFDQNIYNASGFAADPGGPDCFVWRAADKKVTLVSKTSTGTAIGGSGGVTNPSISPDGKIVTFLSDFNAQNIANRFTRFGQFVFLDSNDSPDIFRVDTTTPGSVPEPVSVFYAVQKNNFLGKNSNNDTEYQMMGATANTSGKGMSVDPLGRYVTAGGAGFVGLFSRTGGTVDADAFRFTFNVGTGVPTAQNRTPYNIDTLQFTPNPVTGDIFAGLIATSVLPSLNDPGSGGVSFFTPFTPPTIQTAVSTGSAQINNAIVALYNADVIFTYRQVTPTANARLIALPGYTSPPTGAGAAQFDLFQKGFIGSTIQFRLISHQTGSKTQGVGALDLRAGGYTVTPDATKMLFTTAAAAGKVVDDPAQLSAGAMVDINNQFDVFQFDGDPGGVTSLASVRTSTLNATGAGESVLPTMTPDGIAIAFQSTVLSDSMTNVPDGNGPQTDIFVRDTVLRQTILASGTPANIASGNGASTTAFVVRSAVVNRQFFRNFEVLFTSAATDLDPAVTIDPTNPQVFSSQFPIFVSGLTRTLSFSGGEGGFVTIARTDNLGNLLPISPQSKFQPFAGYTGELRVATADFNGDGTPDVAVAAGPGGGPRVSIIDGRTLRPIDNFFAFESGFTGGVYVAAGDLNNAGVAELIVGAGEGGGPRLQVYNVATRVRIIDQFAYEASSRTGVHVAVGDFDGDGRNDVFIGAGSGGGPRVRVLSGASLPNQNVLADFFAFNSNDRNGVNISAGDYDSDGKSDIVVGTGNGSAPRVIIYNAANTTLSDPITSPFSVPPQSVQSVNQVVKFLDFTPFTPSDDVGARAVLRNIDGGKLGGLVVSTGGQLPRIQTYSGSRRGVDPLGNGGAPQLLKEQIPFDSLFGNFGAWVG